MSQSAVIATPALRTIARMAGVSISTVSMALANHPDVNAQTRRRIRALSRTIGYRRTPRRSAQARGPGVRPGTRFGMLLLGSPLEDDGHLATVHSLTAAATSENIRMEVRAIENVDHTSDVIEACLDYTRSLDGLILTGLIEGALIEELDTVGIPHVVVGHTMEAERWPTMRIGQVVDSDTVAMGELATRTLLHAGHERIGFVCERLPRNLWNDRWLRGYQLALLQEGTRARPQWVHVANQIYVGGEPAATAFVQMSADEAPTAYVIPDARVAGSFRRAMRRLGRPLEPATVIASGHTSLLERYGVADLPWIGYDVDLLSAVAVRQLRLLCVEPMPCTTEIIVPFATRRLPEPRGR